MNMKYIQRNGAYVFVTRRTSERRFFLRPGKRANQGFKYCLALAAQRTGVKVLWAGVMSNHYHMGLHDPDGKLPKFMAELNRLVSKHHNAMYGRTGNLFDTRHYNYQYLATYDDLLDKAAYTLANPARAGLVDRVEDWPGFITKPGMLGRSELVRRPDIYFKNVRGNCPDVIELRFHLPEEFETSPAAWRKKVKQRLLRIERSVRRQREQRGFKVLGAARAMAVHHEDKPKTEEPWFQLAPRVAARHAAIRERMLTTLRRFRDAYNAALERWRAGDRNVVFPPGTYWMRVFHNARCATDGGTSPFTPIAAAA